MRKWLSAGLALGLLAACATSGEPTPEPGWQARHAAGEALREAVRFAGTPLPDAWTDVAVTATPVRINDDDLARGTGALVYAGGVEITSGFDRLHGLSDIKFEDAEHFYAVSDEGLLVRGRVALDTHGHLFGVDGVQVRPLNDPDGLPLIPKYLADAEGLAILANGELLVSFERDHRVWRYDREGKWLGERVIPDFSFTENDGMEGITAYGQDSAYWVAGENGGMWSCAPEVCRDVLPPPATPPADNQLRVTSLATFGERGIYAVQRAYHADRNTNSISIARLERAENFGGDAILWRPLATFTAPATVDNFEGIAAVRRADGGVRLYILSDDNFNARQRTLLLAFDVRD